ncbi:MAG: hypothetical protein CVU77_03585 [Elusimicrobia bacterium HGW-Elusimicrobia-1]|jgi:lipoprotein-releasing system permease protein|nr:MAG: hypothetical protein CVU77_03585 [Elusimicrobia bacterium HGW-Elusimicrobia-1]
MLYKIPSEIYLAAKFISVRKKSFFGALTLAIAVGGVALGVASLIITLAVMSGFQTEIRSKIIGFNPHVIVFSPTGAAYIEKISTVSGVRSVRPFIWAQSVAQSRASAAGVAIKGVDDDTTADISEGEIKPGRDLARALEISIGDDLAVFASASAGFGAMPRVTKLKVAGFFETGMHDYDANVAVARMATARDALGLDENAVTGLGLIIDDPDNPLAVSRGIIAAIPRAQVRTWQQMNRNLFEALKLEKIMMFIILTLIIIVAAFNIVSNLSLFVTQKSREIGVLKSLGMSSGAVSRVFVMIGAMLGTLGTFAGSVVGISVCVVLRKYDIIKLPSDVYFISRLPVRIVASDVLWTVLVSIAITVLATLLPSRKAGAMNTAEIFRYG